MRSHEDALYQNHLFHCESRGDNKRVTLRPAENETMLLSPSSLSPLLSIPLQEIAGLPGMSAPAAMPSSLYGVPLAAVSIASSLR